jgi:hypothetical protein
MKTHVTFTAGLGAANPQELWILKSALADAINVAEAEAKKNKTVAYRMYLKMAPRIRTPRILSNAECQGLLGFRSVYRRRPTNLRQTNS